MANHELDILTEHLPVSLHGRIALSNNTLYISTELRGNEYILSFIGYAKKSGYTNIVWLSPEQFSATKRKLGNTSTNMADADVQKAARNIFQQAHDMGASDIHIINKGTHGLIRFRIYGFLQDHIQFESSFTERLISTIYSTMSTGQSDGNFTPTKRQDAIIADPKWLPYGVQSIRVHTEPLHSSDPTSRCGTFMPLRLLHDRSQAQGSLEDRVLSLGFDEKDAATFRSLTRRTGLTIVSGPTGHGKSTILKHIMEGQATSNPERCYLSIEDPVEYPIKGVQQMLISTKTSDDPKQRGRNYTDALAGAMRSDPDVIMIGEIRYPEAAAAAMDMALTGHAVWTTIHANNAFGIITRMISLLSAANYVEPLDYLCNPNIIAGLIDQRLLPVLCPHCKISLHDIEAKKELLHPQLLSSGALERLRDVMQDRDNVAVQNYKGCEHCNGMGIKGQTVVAEVIETDEILLNFLHQGDLRKAGQYWKTKRGGRRYLERTIDLIAQGHIDPMLAELRLGLPLNIAKVSAARLHA